jgi:hypothetical protein
MTLDPLDELRKEVEYAIQAIDGDGRRDQIGLRERMQRVERALDLEEDARHRLEELLAFEKERRQEAEREREVAHARLDGRLDSLRFVKGAVVFLGGGTIGSLILFLINLLGSGK